MKHRYGRHGAGAWLRQYLKKRKKWQSYLPATHAFFSVTPIALPGFRGKAFLVLMQDDELNAQQPPNEDQSLIDRPTVDAVKNQSPVPINSSITPGKRRMMAQGQHIAFKHLAEARELKALLLLCKENLHKVANRSSDVWASPAFTDGSTEPTPVLRAAFEQAYLATIEAGIQTDYRDLFISPQEARIQEIAREDAHRHIDDRGYHLRDLAVIRAQQHLSVTVDESLDRLGDIHAWADQYDRARQTRKTWEVWPDLDNFRPW